jgi:hypothetical protein
MPAPIDITGKRFGRLVAVKRSGHKGRITAWLCKCDCGNSVVVRTTSLTCENHTRSCGCLQKLTQRLASAMMSGGAVNEERYQEVRAIIMSEPSS